MQKKIASRFVVEDHARDLLGRGGMGEVYRAVDTRTGEVVAVKALKPEIVDSNPEIVKRFLREGEALRQLNHPNIVKMLAAVEEDGQYFLIMEYVGGGSLREFMYREGQLPLDRVVHIALELCDALTRAHLLNIIHRDLKPANVLLSEDRTPRLTDFGIAHVGNQPRLTQTGAVMGTFHYMSPELCLGEKPDTRTDIWAFGVLLYEMLAGQVPFDGETLPAVMRAILHSPPPDISQLRSDLPLRLGDLINRMLLKDRDGRIPSVRMVGAELEAIIQGRTLTYGALAPSPFSQKPASTRTATRPNHLSQLRRKLTEYFSLEELRTLCFDLNVDFESLPAEGKEGKARELVALIERNGRVTDLVALCSHLRPNRVWTYQASLFICYKRHAERDNRLALYLRDRLAEQGHEPFIDQGMRAGTEWLEEIDRQIQRSDFLIVLLSRESAHSEMVQAEVKRAFDYCQLQGSPLILPVRVAYSGMLPYSIDAFLNPLQYVTWQNERDNEALAVEILTAIVDGLPDKPPAPLTASLPEVVEYSEDGRLITDHKVPLPPLPEFDPRLLEELTAPGGALHIHDRFYVLRKADEQLNWQLARAGTITTIRASRQTGKSSLLVRGAYRARTEGAHVVTVDLQRVGQKDLQSADAFLRYLANVIMRRLRLDASRVEKAWQSSFGPQDKLTYLMEDHVLPAVGGTIVLAMDEVDRLLGLDYQSDFFALIRSWHNSAAYDDLWQLLSIIMVISTEPYLLIADANQSPFNVGLRLNLQDFTTEQVQDLNGRHQSPVAPPHFDHFMHLLGGQPYLTRAALYVMVMEPLGWQEFTAIAPTNRGPFGDHLRRQHWLLREDESLRVALKDIIRNNKTGDEKARFRLLRAGLIKGSGGSYTCRCDLYRIYFKDKL